MLLEGYIETGTNSRPKYIPTVLQEPLKKVGLLQTFRHEKVSHDYGIMIPQAIIGIFFSI